MTKVFKILFICCLVALFIILPGNFSPWIKQQYSSNTTPVQPVELSLRERNWLKVHQPIRIAFDGNFPPYSFINEAGQIAGISYDTLQLISQKLNIKIKIDDKVLWKDIYQAALNKRIDVIATMVNRHDREFQFSFTQPYIFKSLVIVTHITNQKIKDRSHLSGKTVALVKGYLYSKHILKDHPDIIPFYVDTMEDALFAVETKQADAAISFFSTSYYFQNKNLLSNIKFAGYFDRNSANESMAVRSDWPILTKILQKGLDSLTEAEKRSIRSKWHRPIQFPVDYEMMTRVIVTSLLIFFILLIWLGQINRQKQKIKRTKNILQTTNSELNELKETLENKVFQRTKQLQNSEQKYRSLVENLQDEYFFFQHDLDKVFTYLSPSFTVILGYSVDTYLKKNNTLLTDHPDNALIDDYTNRCLKGDKVPVYEVEVFDNKGHKHCLEVLSNALYDDEGKCIGLEGIAHDITLLKQTQKRLNWLSYYDDLTGLANRRLFNDRIKHLINLAQRNQESLALLFMDLDRFKIINDSLGHSVGDKVLQETASRILVELRSSDIAARMGGDEFSIVLPSSDAAAAKIVANKILQSLLTPFCLNEQQFTLGTSIGIAIYPQDGKDGETLLQRADAAMYVAKKTKTGYAFSSFDQNQTNNRRIELELDLRKALAKNCYEDDFELKIVFQAKHFVTNNALQGYEALMRWQHPELGLISPIEFIPLAEETGLIVELSHWVMTKVCMQAMIWSQDGYNFGKIAVNISATELINLELANNIINQIDATGAQREWIEIEITENALIKMPDVAVKIMHQLVKAGVLIAIDDFGTGYSSLSYLKTIPASYIKIDQSFIHNILNSPEDQAVVHAVIAMSHALGKQVIAEGVETREQLHFLSNNGCDIVQGFWFSQPVAAKKIV